MKDVTLYTIVEHKVRGGDYVDLFKYRDINLSTSDILRVAGEDYCLVVDKETIPVYTIIKPMYEHSNNVKYVAIDPHLKTFLENPFKGEMEAAHNLLCRCIKYIFEEK